MSAAIRGRSSTAWTSARWGLSAVLLAIVLTLAACGSRRPAEPALELRPASFASLRDWPGDDPAGALRAFVAACTRITRASAGPLGELGYAGDLASWQSACAAAGKVPAEPAAAVAFFEANFQPWALTDRGAPEGLFTGYYEPILAGSRTPDQRYRFPLHARPDDLVRVDLGRFSDDLKGRRIAGRVVGEVLVPYPDRAEIDQGALVGRGLELFWVDDPVGKFFLQIQGSGRIRLPDGSIARVGYADQNGRTYRAIGRDLVASGALDKDTVSLQTIRAWLEAHKLQADAVMWRNPSYVFFRTLPDLAPDQGAPGALGVPLVAGHSIAVDRRYVPLGAPVWLDTSFAAETGGAPLRRLTVALDTGGAIRGPVRADLFLGVGPDAERLAGPMKSPGRAWILLPKAAR